MLWLPVTSDAAAFHWLFQLTFDVQFSARYVSPGMLPLAAQPPAHASTTRIRFSVARPGSCPPPHRLRYIPKPASSRSRLLNGEVHLAWVTRLPKSRYPAVSGARVADAEGVGGAVEPAKISSSPDFRQASPENPLSAPPSHGICWS